MNIIEIDHLTKNYGRARGIEDVSFHVKKGEIFGFIGPNGAGKSTTIRTMLSLIKPTSGTAKLFGTDCTMLTNEILSKIGYLPSEVFYYDNMKVMELLKYSASFYKKDCTDKIKKLAEILQLDLNKKIDDLSYGNKKKVGIIQGLIHEPELIILDEPTGGLDPLMQQTFFNLLREENKKGTTILFSSHILSEVEKMCDRVGIIKNGKMIKVDTIASLKENSSKKVFLETKEIVEEGYFNAMKGIQKLDIIGNEISFLFQGNVNSLIQKIAGLSLNNILIVEPELEEIFMHYYE